MQSIQKAAIDNDFLNHLTEIKTHPNLKKLIETFFNALSVYPVMHPLVYEKETVGYINNIGKYLFDSKVVAVELFVEYLNTEKSLLEYYSMLIRDIYKQFTGKNYPCDDILSEWRAGFSLGEVHTVAMCAMLEYDCFLSDDKDTAAKLQGIVDRRLRWKINIYNRKNRCEYIKGLSEKERLGLTSNDLKKLSHSR